MKGEIAECQVPSATVTGPVIQVYSHNGAKRLVVALPNSAILVSQEWLTTIAGWTFFSGPEPGLKNSACENKVYPAAGKQAFVLSMKNGLPYLSKDLFWMAMGDIAKHATLVSGHSWQELKEMLDNQAHEPQPQIYSVKAVEVPETPMVLISLVARTKCFEPWKIRAKVIEWLKHLHPSANPNRGRLSGTAQSLTFGAQTGYSPIPIPDPQKNVGEAPLNLSVWSGSSSKPQHSKTRHVQLGVHLPT